MRLLRPTERRQPTEISGPRTCPRWARAPRTVSSAIGPVSMRSALACVTEDARFPAGARFRAQFFASYCSTPHPAPSSPTPTEPPSPRTPAAPSARASPTTLWARSADLLELWQGDRKQRGLRGGLWTTIPTMPWAFFRFRCLSDTSPALGLGVGVVLRPQARPGAAPFSSKVLFYPLPTSEGKKLVSVVV